MLRGSKFKGPAADFDDLAESGDPIMAVAFGIDYLAFVKGDVCEVKVRFYKAKAGHFAAFDDLYRVKNTDIGEISRKSHVRADLLR